MTPNQTVRAFCMECLGLTYFNKSEIENCKGDTCIGGCALFPYRLGKRIPVKTFRKFCVQCMNGSAELIPNCPATKCKIYQYRFGKSPAHQKIIREMPRGRRFESQNQANGPQPVSWQGPEGDRQNLTVETPDKTNG